MMCLFIVLISTMCCNTIMLQIFIFKYTKRYGYIWSLQTRWLTNITVIILLLHSNQIQKRHSCKIIFFELLNRQVLELGKRDWSLRDIKFMSSWITWELQHKFATHYRTPDDFERSEMIYCYCRTKNFLLK